MVDVPVRVDPVIQKEKPESMRIRILIADDHVIVRDGLTAMLAAQPDMVVVGEATDGTAAVELAAHLSPNVILMDLVMPGKDGLAAIQEIRIACPSAHILVLTSFADDDLVFPAIKAGALGYLLKDATREQLVQAIREVAQGRAILHPAIALKVMRELSGKRSFATMADNAQDLCCGSLTPRELEALRLIAQGLTNQEIARLLVIHERTVAKYVSSILEKLHLANRTQAALYALKQGLASLE